MAELRMPDDVMWESVQTGLSARIVHEFGASWWVKISFPYDKAAESVLISLRHAIPFQPFVTVFQIALPFIVPRWTGDLEICSELINNLFEALANSARLYMADVTPEPTAIPTPAPEPAAAAQVFETAFSRRLDRFCADPLGKRIARAIDGWGE
jgi:hypothetical protein